MPKILHPDGRLAKAKTAAERAEIQRALRESGGAVENAAALLGVSTRGLYKRIADLGIRVEPGGAALKPA